MHRRRQRPRPTAVGETTRRPAPRRSAASRNARPIPRSPRWAGIRSGTTPGRARTRAAAPPTARACDRDGTRASARASRRAAASCRSAAAPHRSPAW
ncbi:MAG: hypothetical protein E6J45_11220 [Chloroflexi bacterium]|nr:MAG: hypothetical protein E6J45_11220 [Chloroflexota bacterium]